MAIAATHPFIASLEHMLGFFLVLSALLLLWGLTSLIGKIFAKSSHVRGQEELAAAVNAEPEGITEEEVIAVTACIASLMGQRSRIVSIRSATADWSREGRREHFASHKIR